MRTAMLHHCEHPKAMPRWHTLFYAHMHPCRAGQGWKLPGRTDLVLLVIEIEVLRVILGRVVECHAAPSVITPAPCDL